MVPNIVGWPIKRPSFILMIFPHVFLNCSVIFWELRLFSLLSTKERCLYVFTGICSEAFESVHDSVLQLSLLQFPLMVNRTGAKPLFSGVWSQLVLGVVAFGEKITLKFFISA